MSQESAQAEWQRKILEYVASHNAFVARGLRDGWEKAGESPCEPDLEHLVNAAMAAVRQANLEGEVDRLRELWPPTHSPLIELLKKNGQSIPVVCILPDNSIVARIGASYEPGRTIHIVGDSVTDVPDIGFFGRSPNRKYFAIAQLQGIQIIEGWQGPPVAFCPWPTGLEGIPEGFNARPLTSPPTPTRLIPFPDGKRVLLVSREGIFVLSETIATRLRPAKEDIQEYCDPTNELVIDSSMGHGTISNDGKLIVIGDQGSTHLIFDDRLSLIGNIANLSEYPHYALFSSDNTTIALNGCYFYNGATIGISTNLIPELGTEIYEEKEHIIVLDEDARIYAGTSRNDEFIIGDADGYVWAFSTTGEPRWRFFIGSTVGDMDISDDGETLVVSTYAGFLVIVKMDAGEQAPHQIGNSNHKEIRRWIFWKNEPQPLIW